MAKIVKRKRQDGGTSYVVDFFDLQGHRRRETFRRERDARHRLAQVGVQKDTGELLPRSQVLTFTELVRDFKVAHYPSVRAGTTKQYDHFFDTYLVPALGPKRLTAVRVKDVEQLRASVQEQVRAVNGTDGVRTTNKVLTLLGTVLRYAEKHSYVTRNVAAHVRKLRVPFNRQRERLEGSILTAAELQRLIGACDDRWRPHVMTAALTGLRQGELLALTWDAIDLDAARLHVRRSLAAGALQEPKTPAALRAVPLPAELVAELRRWKLRCGSKDLAFPNGAGHVESPSNLVNRGFKPALKRAGLKRIRFHDLRHTYASLLISAGESIKVVQRLLGHSSVQLTLDVYAHLLPDDVDGVAARLGEQVFKRSTTSMV